MYDEHSRVLILGTMPSPKSRELGFYYMHPQNRFWKMLAEMFAEPIPQGREDRRVFALRHHIALWDVLAACEINGAADSSIKNAVPNDIRGLLGKCPIKTVFTTGKKAHELYSRFFPDLKDICLPSTSPANRTLTEAQISEQYRVILNYLKEK